MTVFHHAAASLDCLLGLKQFLSQKFESLSLYFDWLLLEQAPLTGIPKAEQLAHCAEGGLQNQLSVQGHDLLEADHAAKSNLDYLEALTQTDVPRS